MKYYKILIGLILLWIFTISLKGQAQNTANVEVQYEYDLGGNCVSRNVITLKKSNATEQLANNNLVFDDKEVKIAIYPNPTQGLLKIEIPDYIKNEKIYFSIYDLNGKLCLKRVVDEKYSQLDMSNYPNNTYILHINRKGKNSSWKIIKVN